MNPLNAVRLREMRRLIKSAREASAHDWKIEWLKPFMHPRTRSRQAAGCFPKGTRNERLDAEQRRNISFMGVENRGKIPLVNPLNICRDARR